MTINSQASTWASVGVLAARWIFAAAFLISLVFKLKDIDGTAAYVASAGLPFPMILTWLSVLFELALVACLVTGAFFTEAALLAAAFVLLLGFLFHGPSHWPGNNMEFGFFVDHCTFIAGLLYAASHGPGPLLASGRRFVGARTKS
jgi:putative oxidoreductase